MLDEEWTGLCGRVRKADSTQALELGGVEILALNISQPSFSSVKWE